MGAAVDHATRSHASLDDRAGFRLFFNDRCPPCRILSRLAVEMSLRTIRRVAVDSAEAAGFRERHPAWRGELLMTDGTVARIWVGPAVFRAVPLAILTACRRALGRRLTN
jgi:hypothetical protein